MKYFVKFFEGNTDNKEVDITVHCDISIFEWLVNYIYQKDKMIK